MPTRASWNLHCWNGLRAKTATLGDSGKHGLQARRGILHTALLKHAHGASEQEGPFVGLLQACTKMPPKQENVKMCLIQVHG